MALLKISCNGCTHTFYRVVVACNREGVDMTCPQCQHDDGLVHVVKTKDGTSPFAPCTHLPEKKSTEESSTNAMQKQHVHALDGEDQESSATL